MQVSAAAGQASTAPVLCREDIESIAVLTLNRPERRNTLSEAMLVALQSSLSTIATEGRVGAVVLAARGPTFCAGHDLKELTAHRQDADGGRAYFGQMMELCAGVMQTIIAAPQPVIAAVQGTA